MTASILECRQGYTYGDGTDTQPQTQYREEDQQHPRSDYHRMITLRASSSSIYVVPPEKPDGNAEYKRQVLNMTSSRLRSLATQMSYRLDQGMGRCQYYIGVEDDGAHSLLDYRIVAESARILECIARSLNAIVLERVMIQGEVIKTEMNDKMQAVDLSTKEIIQCQELPIFHHHDGYCSTFDGHHGNPTLRPTTEYDSVHVHPPSHNQVVPSLPLKTIDTQDGVATRCHLIIQRVETHLLDPSPVSIAELTVAGKSHQLRDRALSSVSDGIHAAAEASALFARMTVSDETSQGKSTSKQSSDTQDDSTSTNHSSTSSSFSNGHGSNHQNHSCTSGGGQESGDDSDNDGDANKLLSMSMPTVCETLSSRNIRVAVVGNVDAGKSSLIGTLVCSMLDDGRGSSRTAIMKHRHEIESGRTSTATTHLLGFRHSGEPVLGRDSIRTNRRKTEDEIAREAYRLITLMDLAGHEKYLKTTIHGVSSGMADYALILVNSRQPPTHMTQHHLNLCCNFGIPVIIVFTKIDGCPENAFKKSKEEVFKMLKASDVGRKPFMIRNEQDIATVMGKMNSLAPIIETSCVTGQGLDLLRKVLFSVPKRRQHEKKKDRPFEFLVEDTFFNVPGVGTVVSGFVNAGELAVASNCHVFVGPMDDGSFLRTIAKSAHVARINTTLVTAGQSACLAFALKKEDRHKLRRGMVVLRESPTSTREFDAEICVLKGEGTTIRKSYQAYVHILNVRQSAFARKIEIVNNNALGLPPSHSAHHDDEDGIVLRPGSRAKVRFEFVKRPEYIRPGMRMIFRDGRVRGVGIVTSIPTSN